jgi:hypothetical protein
VTRNTLQHDSLHDTKQFDKNKEWIRNWLEQSRVRDE